MAAKQYYAVVPFVVVANGMTVPHNTFPLADATQAMLDTIAQQPVPPEELEDDEWTSNSATCGT